LMLNTSKAATTTGGLSTIVDLKHRAGGDKLVERIWIRGRTIYFNKEKTASIRCVSEDAAKFVFELMKEKFETLKNRTLDEVMSSVKLPKDNQSLQQVQKYVKRRNRIIKRSARQVGKLKEQLDEKVAEIYGLRGQIDVIRNALKVISGKIIVENG